jgi:DNA repair photolyase
MKLNKSKGNMYDWVTHTWSPVTGCQHQCRYCYVRTYRELENTVRMLPGPMPSLGNGRTIFVAHMADMFSSQAPEGIIRAVLGHCGKFPENHYVFQTKNPRRISEFIGFLPTNSIVGCTIETNRQELIDQWSKAPDVVDRVAGMSAIHFPKFVTVEPIMDFDVHDFAVMIKNCEPDFVNIGADSKGHILPEPTMSKVLDLVATLGDMGIQIRKKVNLGRLEVYPRQGG